MLLAVWIALAVSAVFVLGPLAFAVTRGLTTWRTFRRFRRSVADGQTELMRRVLAIEKRMETANRSAARLQRAQAELQTSLRAARMLAAAFSEVRATVGSVTGIVPRK